MAAFGQWAVAVVLACLSVASGVFHAIGEGELDMEGTEFLGPEATKSPHIIHAIGDSHGDLDHMVRCLLSTGLFEFNPDNKNIQWKERLPENEEVVVLGDFLDRGSHDRQIALLLMQLRNKEPNHLTVTMGNHETFLLLHIPQYAHPGSELSEDVRKATVIDGTGLPEKQKSYGERLGQLFSGSPPPELSPEEQATKEQNLAIYEWIQQLPIVYLSAGVLMTHGGFSKQLLDMTPESICDGEQNYGLCLTNSLNAWSTEYWKHVGQCMKKTPDPAQCDVTVSMPLWPKAQKDDDFRKFMITAMAMPPYSRDSGPSILWFRGYSAEREGAGNEYTCEQAQTVGSRLGAAAMVVAHETHANITQYCKAVPVFVTDVHTKDCQQTGECDVRAAFAGKTSNAQSLRLRVADGQVVSKQICKLIAWSAQECNELQQTVTAGNF